LKLLGTEEQAFGIKNERKTQFWPGRNLRGDCRCQNVRIKEKRKKGKEI